MSFGLCNAPASFQRCMMSIFSDMIEEIIEVFMDDFSVYGKTFDDCLKIMVRKDIMLGHLVSKRGIEVDKTKIEVIE
jgi:hypothetical protein